MPKEVPKLDDQLASLRTPQHIQKLPTLRRAAMYALASRFALFGESLSLLPVFSASPGLMPLLADRLPQQRQITALVRNQFVPCSMMVTCLVSFLLALFLGQVHSIA